MFQPGISITPTENPMGFLYGEDCIGPNPEVRMLDSIRTSLKDSHCSGPDEVYSDGCL